MRKFSQSTSAETLRTPLRWPSLSAAIPVRGMTGRFSTSGPAARTRSRRLWVPALGRGFCAPMMDRATPMPKDRSLALAARSDCCCRRTLHGIHGVVDRMQGPPCLFDCFRRHRPLHGATWVHRTADTARNKQPGKETHPKPQATKWLYRKTTPAAIPAPINAASKRRQADLSAAGRSRPAIPHSLSRIGQFPRSGPGPSTVTWASMRQLTRLSAGHTISPARFSGSIRTTALAASAFAEAVRRAAR